MADAQAATSGERLRAGGSPPENPVVARLNNHQLEVRTGRKPSHLYADPRTDEGRDQRFWLGQLYAALAGYLGSSLLILTYVGLSWEQPHRGWILVIMVLVLAFTLWLYVFRHWIVTSRYQLAIFVGGTVAAFVVLIPICVLDGGVSSPLTYLFLLPMVYLGLGFTLRWVLFGGFSGVLSYTVLVGLSDPPMPYLMLMVQVVVLCDGFLLAGIGAAHRDRKDRDLRDLRLQLEITAATDELTGCLNQRSFTAALSREVARSARGGHALSLLLIDIDFFKKVNDCHGHMMGDEVLRQVGDALRVAARQADVAGRPGGDELALLAPETESDAARLLAERLRERISNLAVPIEITLSIGICAMVPDAEQAATLFRRADQALYQAKQQGRNRVAVFDDAEESAMVLSVAQA